MPRRSSIPCALAILVVSILGCQPKAQTDVQMAGSYDSLAPVDSYPQETTMESFTLDSGSPDSYLSGSDSAAGQVYTVKRKDTLYSIARAFYGGDHSKWRSIYDANRERINDPNHISVGMKLIIPTQ